MVSICVMVQTFFMEKVCCLVKTVRSVKFLFSAGSCKWLPGWQCFLISYAVMSWFKNWIELLLRLLFLNNIFIIHVQNAFFLSLLKTLMLPLLPLLPFSVTIVPLYVTIVTIVTTLCYHCYHSYHFMLPFYVTIVTIITIVNHIFVPHFCTSLLKCTSCTSKWGTLLDTWPLIVSFLSQIWHFRK